ncbi:MAG: hypothetical protein U0X87_08005 [Anaerolineales bacterium]
MEDEEQWTVGNAGHREATADAESLAITAGILCVLSLAIDLYTVAALILLTVLDWKS